MKNNNKNIPNLVRPSIIDSIKVQLLKELPGFEAQHIMSPKLRYKENEFKYKKDKVRLSSVLIPLYFKNDELLTILTQRPEYEGVHSKQISFPGGKKDATDPDLQFTALREACEEVNICENEIEIIGKLTDLYIPPSNFLVSPYVGYLKEYPNLIPQENEVVEIMEIPIKTFLKKETIKTKTIHLANGVNSETPYFDIYGKVVWGATAMILSEFVQILKKIVTING